MMRTLLVLPLLLAACRADETVSAFADPQAVYRLVEINGTPFAGHATIRFPEEGRVTGRGPCNSFTASQSAPYPWFRLGPLAATRALCPAISAERAYFAALAGMSEAEIMGGVLILRNDAGEEMVFQAEGAE